MEAYVAEIEGLSGSPIWSDRLGTRNQRKWMGARKSRLFQVVEIEIWFSWACCTDGGKCLSRRWKDRLPSTREVILSGMSIMVPAHKILEVVNQPELAPMRKENDEKIAKESRFIR